MRYTTPSASKLRVTAYPILLLAGLAATAGARYTTDGPGAVVVAGEAGVTTTNEVYLPVEIAGPDGTTRNVELMVSDANGVDSLYIVGHALGYHNSERLWNGTIQRDGKASYRVNGGPWMPISNDAANVRFPESRYLGIGGGYHTVRLTVPVSGVQSGSNTIEFRFNGTEGVSSGYRILELDLRAGTQSRISGTTFIQNDPNWWTAPAGSDAARGRTAWEARNVLRESSLPNAPIITASCSDCHAYSGFDLKYFNYSNLSIEARAQFHGMTAEQGRDIAAYIREVDLGRRDGQNTSPYARPWNPVYQPGPGITDRGEEDWAAGAGLEWVLDTDDETAYYLFPDGAGNVPNVNPSDEDIARAVRVGSWANEDANNSDASGVRIDIQNTPIALQYPDWNNWLPDVHPLDAYGYSDFTTTDLWAAHLEMFDRFDTPQKVAETIQRDRAMLTCTGSCSASGFDDIMFRVDANHTDSPLPERFDVTYAGNPSRFFLAHMSISQWQAVKTWEVMNRFDLQDVGEEMFGGLVTPAPWDFAGTPVRVTGSRSGQDTPFFWPGSQNIIFDMAPHMNGRCGSDCPGGAGFPIEGPYGPPGTQVLSGYFTTAWYDVQLMLSRELTGIPASTGGGPIDWNYQTDAAVWAHTLNVSQFWRVFRARVIATQSRNNIYGQATTWYQHAFNGGPGFTATNANFWEVIGRTPQLNGTDGYNRLASDIPFTRRALRHYWNEWFSFARTVPTEAWVREPEPTGFLESPDVTPQAHVPGTGALVFDAYTDANNTYRLPALMVAWGMDSAAVDNVARWGETMWPSGNWEQWFVGTAGEPPGDTPETWVMRLGQTIPNPFTTSVTIPYELSRHASVQVQVYDSIGRLVATLVDGEQAPGSYSPVFESGALPSGLYLCRVRAGGETATRTMVLTR